MIQRKMREKTEKNVSWSNFEDWDYVVQSGNFLVKSFEDEELHYFVVKAAAGHWSLVLRNDHPLYHLIQEFINTEDDNLGNAIDLIFGLNYTMSAVAPDAKFVEEFYGAVNGLMERVDAYEQANRTITDEKVLEQDEYADEITEQMEQLAQQE